MKTTLTFICIFLSSFFIAHAQTPTVGGWNVYYGHLHNHTSDSDGEGTPADAYTHARDVAGLDFMGISDHAIMISSNEWSNLKNTANDFNADGSFVTFWGFEWSSNFLYGHVTVVNTEDYTTVLKDFTFAALNDWLDPREGIAFFNHPGREDNGLEFEHFEFPPSDRFVGIELWNKGSGFEEYYYNDGYFDNDRDRGYFDEALQRGWKVGATGAHDHHGRSWGETDMAMAVLSNSLTREDLYAAFKARRFYSTEDRSIAMSVQLNGSEMGSTVVGGNLQQMRIQAFDRQSENFTRVELYRNGVLFYTWPINTTNVDISYDITTTGGEYYYVKVTQQDGDEAISSPVFIEGDGAGVPPQVALLNPSTGSRFTNGTSISLQADVADVDGTVSQVSFYNGAQKLGESLTSPYNFVWENVTPGTYQLLARATDNSGNVKASEAVHVVVEAANSITVSSRVSHENDDAEQGWTGIMYRTSSDLELVNDGWKNSNQRVGMRFKGLNIPQNAMINNAYIQFTCNEPGSRSTNVNLRGESTDHALSFGAQDISSRSLTSNGVDWSIEPWSVPGEAGPKQRTPGLKNVVQEIVSRPGWSLSSAMAFVVRGKGRRTAESYDGSSERAPLLVVEYTTSVTPTVPAARVASSVTENPIENDLPADTQEVIVYPNPFGAVINVLLPVKGQAAVTLYNMKGQVMTSMMADTNEFNLDTSQLGKGVYILSIVTEDEKITRKLIRE